MFESIRSVRVSEEIAQQIREAVFRGRLRTGDKLPAERELVQQFRVSRVSVREALRMLQQEGLLVIKQGSVGGAYVASPDSKPVTDSLVNMMRLGKFTIEQITEVRSILEPRIAFLAAERGSEEELKQLKKILLDAQKAVRQNKLPRRFNLEFHRAIAIMAKNPVLALLFNSFMEILTPAIQPGFQDMKTVVDSHKRLLRALEARDGGRAARVMSDHVRDVQDRVKGQRLRGKKVNGQC
ncbi:MAG: FadR family transcriptional regulator [Acidobacteria bacterium]|nr:FadR family transcriptional regulator [Acidobacteriota bacterium]